MSTNGKISTGSGGLSTGMGSRLSRRALMGVGGAAVAAGAGLGLSGCGDSGGGGDGSTLTFVFYGDAEGQKAYDPLFVKFREDHPEIELKAQGIAADTWADFSNAVATRIAGGQQLDVVQIATEGQRIFMTKDLLEPLDDFIAQDQALVDEYYADTPEPIRKHVQTYASQDGHTYYIPGGYNTMALYVNTEIFAEAGVAVPEDTWTWDEFRAAGQEIKAKTGAFLTSAASGLFGDVMPWVLNNGGAPLDAEWAHSTFNSPEVLEALTFVRSLVADGFAPQPGGEFDAPTAMAQGQLASFGGGRWPTNDLRRVEFIDPVQLVKWPQKAAPGSPVGWDAWPILKGSKNKDAAWTLITYLMSEEFGDAITAGAGAAVPARISDATSPAFLEDAPKNTELLVELLDVSTPVPGTDRGAEVQKVIEEAWLQGISGTKEPQAALNEAHTKLEDLLS